MQNNNKQKVDTIYVNKTNLTTSIYIKKFQYSAHLVLLIGERCAKQCRHLTCKYS